MKFLAVFFTLFLTYNIIAIEDSGHALVDSDDYGQVETPSHVSDASNFYGEVIDDSNSEVVIEKADHSAKKSKEFRKSLPEGDSKRDIASQNKIDSNWTEELTELHKMDED